MLSYPEVLESDHFMKSASCASLPEQCWEKVFPGVSKAEVLLCPALFFCPFLLFRLLECRRFAGPRVLCSEPSQPRGNIMTGGTGPPRFLFAFDARFGPS
jgi:hypothetical protein